MSGDNAQFKELRELIETRADKSDDKIDRLSEKVDERFAEFDVALRGDGKDIPGLADKVRKAEHSIKDFRTALLDIHRVRGEDQKKVTDLELMFGDHKLKTQTFMDDYASGKKTQTKLIWLNVGGGIVTAWALFGEWVKHHWPF